jgi:putative transcriptional regulator
MPPSDGQPATADWHSIQIHLDQLLHDRGMTLTELAEQAGISIVNLSILKNGHARAIRFTSLTRICQALSCQPGDLMTCTTSPQILPASARHESADATS